MYINNNPEPPKMNSLIKIHKLNNPIRPLINFKNAPTYKIAKTIAQKLKSNHLTNNHHNIKNTYELIDKLKTININENTFFTSYDITNMYTNIPVEETLDIIINKLIEQNENKQYITEIKNSLQLILKQNYFEFNSKIYQQKEGLAMGSPCLLYTSVYTVGCCIIFVV